MEITPKKLGYWKDHGKIDRVVATHPSIMFLGTDTHFDWVLHFHDLSYSH